MRRVVTVIGGVFAAASAALAMPAMAGADCSLPGADDATMSSQQDFGGSFGSDLQGSYVQIPFDVPGGTTGIRIRYCYDQPPPGGGPVNTLDMGVYEPLKSGDTVWGPPERRGWSGSAVKDLAIAVNGFSSESAYLAARKAYVSGRTTRAYEPGPLPAGKWAVELGLAAIAPPPGDPDGIAWRVRVETSSDGSWADDPYAPVAYDDSAVSQEPGWYVGDLHAHGEEEPGNATMKQTFDYGFRPIAQGGAGLDFMTLVDHNNDVAHVGEIGRRQPDYPGKLILPGTEVTTYEGHYNNQGSSVFADFRGGPVYSFDASDSSLTKASDAAVPASQFGAIRAAGGWTQINHPTVPGGPVCRGCPWDWSDAETDYSKVDAVEIQNGPAEVSGVSNPFTTSAIAFYEKLLAGGRHVAAVGSSDSHQADVVDGILGSPIGRGATAVFATHLSRAAIVAGVQADHTYVKLYGSDGPDIRLTGTSPGAPKAIIGDSLEGPVASFEARVTGAGPSAARPGSYVMKLLRDGTEAASVPVIGDDFSHTFRARAGGRYSLEIAREDPAGDRIEDYSSPIWFTRAVPSNRISLGGLKLNRSRGSARLTVRVPGPGKLSLAGAGLRPAKRRLGSARALALPLKPKGSALRSLRLRGRAAVRARITFAPDYGKPRTVSWRLTLIRR
ncbi:MAG: CehA/McbA family metallohydrolase [Solirubrobacterales bacterium]